MKPVIVGISEYAIVSSPRKLITYGLGSCVAIVLYDPVRQTGAMAHVMLPLAFEGRDTEKPGKYADTAISAMVKDLDQQGIPAGDLTAKLAGGAEMFSGKYQGMTRRIGPRNVMASIEALGYHGVPIAGQDVGGTMGRSVEFHTDSGTLLVRTLRGRMVEL